MNLQVTNFYSSEKATDCPTLSYPEYAFIGRSNVGKSSLINFILNHQIAYTSSKPGKTQLINHIEVNKKWALVDLPGYGYAKLSKLKRKNILNRVNQYFQKRGITLVGVFMLIDIRIPPQKIDIERMFWLVKNNIYFIRVFTKCDKLNKPKIQTAIKLYDKIMVQNNWGKMPDTIITSSKSQIGKDIILNKIKELNELFLNFK